MFTSKRLSVVMLALALSSVAEAQVITPTGTQGSLPAATFGGSGIPNTSVMIGVEEFKKIRESEVIAHADEFETSLYLHLAGDRVQMDKAVEDNDRMGEFVSSDSTMNYFVRFNDYWGRWTKTGVHGDATKGTAEKGKIIFEAAVNGLVKLVDELRAWPIEKRADMHTHPVQSQIQW